MSSPSSPRKCFFCDENPRLEGDYVCRSCKEEHPMCYECGQRKRNLPFKLCEPCYKIQQQRRPGGGVVVTSKSEPDPVVTPATKSVTDDDDVDGVKKVTAAVGRLMNPEPSAAAKPKLLLRLQTDQNTYKEIAKVFTDQWIKLTPPCKKPPVPIAIYAIQNEELAKTYHSYGKKIREDVKSSNSDFFFHGTKLTCNLQVENVCCDDTDCGICGISKDGFDEKRIGTNIPRFQRFGKGIYLAPNSSKCHDYTQGNVAYGVRAQLLCLVAQGAKHELMQDNTALTKPPDSFHSVYGKKGGSLNYDEIVVFDSKAVWPQYIVMYELNGVDKIAK